MVPAIVASLALAPSKPAPSAAAKVDPLVALERRLDTWCERFRGRAGYSLLVLKSGRRIEHRGSERFPSASTIKTALMVEAVNQVDEGKVKWSDKRQVPPMSGRQSSMWSYFFKDGVQPDLDGWVNLMITVSDNTATMVVREWMTPDSTNERMAKLGLPNTKVLWSQFPEGREADRRLRATFGLGVTTPNEMNRLLELIYRGKAASPAGCERMIRILANQYWNDWIGGSAPVDVKVASKSGAINRSRSDSAIVFSDNPYILTIYTDNQKDQRWVAENEGDQLLIRISREVWKTLHPHRPYTPPKGSEKFAPTGGGV